MTDRRARAHVLARAIVARCGVREEGLMDALVKQAWVEALRSGNYVQGSGVLARVLDDDGGVEHCCLGVLCELAVQAGVVERRQTDYAVMFGARSEYLPPSVAAWAGLATTNAGDVLLDVEDFPEVMGALARDEDGDDGEVTIAGVNDAGVSWDVIAKVIDAQL